MYILFAFFFVFLGIEEAKAAGTALKNENYSFDLAYTSVLQRANITLDYILTALGQTDIPIKHSWRLNERHYGGLTGLNKQETAKKFGDEQVCVRTELFRSTIVTDLIGSLF